MTTEATNKASDIFEMSDDEILNMSSPTVEDTQNNPEDDNAHSQNNDDVVATQTEQQQQVEPEVETEVEQVEDANSSNSDIVNDKVDNKEVDSNGKPITEDASTTKQPGQVEGKDKQEETPKSEGLPADFNYKAGYEQIMAPFKANGKMITPRSPEEAISLMQMGANYTRKMQELQPYRKVMLMLENNGLMDEGKLSFLIDLEKKNPEAIKKLIKEAGIDPLDINPEEEVNYQAGNHRVTDAEAAFATELDDLKSTPEGQATLGVIAQTWDAQSKEALFENRGLLQTIQQQRENGIYDRIVSEMSRLQMLGQIPAGTPFLAAYNQVGNQLAAAGGFADLVQPKAEPTVTTPAVKAPVVTRVVQPKPVITNTEQASAASPSRAAPRKVEQFINPLAMSDEDFAKLPVPGRL